MTQFINIADIVDPDDPQGRTYREQNIQKFHNIPMGALVEILSGARLFVVYRGRDCDQTPLYWLCADPTSTLQEGDNQPHGRVVSVCNRILSETNSQIVTNNIFTRMKWYGGFSEENLKVIRYP